MAVRGAARHGGKTGLNSPCVFGPAIHLYWGDIWRQQDSSELTDLRNDKLHARWITDCAHYITKKLRVPPSWAPWTPRKKCYGVPRLERVYKIIDVAYEARMQEMAGQSEAEAMRNFYVNYSQNVYMRPWGSLHTLCQGTDLCDCMFLLVVLCVLLFICLLYVCLQVWVGWQGSQIYSFEKDAILAPEDSIGMIGISIKRWPHGCSAGQLRSLGGEAYGAPCIALIAFAFWANTSAPWLAAKSS